MSDQETRSISFIRPVRAPVPVAFSAEPGAVEVDAARSALLIVDMQNDFLHRDGWFPSSGIDPSPLHAVIPAIATLADTARRCGMPVVWVNWGVRGDRANLPASFVERARDAGSRPTYADSSPTGNGRILVQGEWGAEVIDGLTVDPADIVVSKHRTSGFPDTELDSVLRMRDLTTLFFAGVNTDRCVLATLIDACARGYDCVLVDDACATTSPPHVTDAVGHIVRLLYGVTANSSDISTALGSASN